MPIMLVKVRVEAIGARCFVGFKGPDDRDDFEVGGRSYKI